MINYFWTSIEVGYYHTVQQLSEVIIILSIALDIVLFPTLSEYHSSNNLKGIITTTHKAVRYTSMITIPLIVLIIIFVKPIIYIMLNDAFLPAAPVLIAVIIYSFLLGIMKPYTSLVRGMNKPYSATVIGITICVTNIILNFLFIPQGGLLSSFNMDGAVGAAIATAVSMIIGVIGFQYTAKQLIGMKLLVGHIPRHFIAGGTIASILYFSSSFFTPSVLWYHFIIYAVLGLGLYLLVLILLREFNKQDLQFFLDMIHPTHMMKYIKSELQEK
jgi:O-antigen/teichoic acid export membrane protein